MNALFVTNQLKTIFYDAVARRMEAEGARIHWVSVSRRWTRFLIEKGWPAERILSLPDFAPLWRAPPDWTPEEAATLARIDRGGEAPLNDILIMDREIAGAGVDMRAYAGRTALAIDAFCEKFSIRFGFGEITWAPEQIAAIVLASRGGRYFMHHTIRIPSSRLGLLEGPYSRRLGTFRQADDADRALAAQALAALRDRGERPYYFAKNMNPQRFRAHWLSEAAAALRRPQDSRDDHTVPSLARRIGRRLRLRVRSALVSRRANFQPPPAKDTPFILSLLHRQPESSVDVLGAPLNNQLEVLRAFARLLPFGWELWVKEHGHAIGDRPLSWYRELCDLPGVRLIDPHADTFALMRRARLVASTTGTASMEAGVIGIPAITFARTLFSPLLLRPDLDPFAMNASSFDALLAEAERFRSDPLREERTLDFLALQIANSVEARTGDPANDPGCMDPANIEQVARLSMQPALSGGLHA